SSCDYCTPTPSRKSSSWNSALRSNKGCTGKDGVKNSPGSRKKNGLKVGCTAKGGRTVNGGCANGETGLITTAPGATPPAGGSTTATTASALFAVPTSNDATNTNSVMIPI